MCLICMSSEGLFQGVTAHGHEQELHCTSYMTAWAMLSVFPGSKKVRASTIQYGKHNRLLKIHLLSQRIQWKTGLSVKLSNKICYCKG